MARVPTTIQKLLFRTDKWSPATIRLWVARQPASRHLTADKIEEKPIDYHVRQRDPEDFVPGSFRTIPLGKKNSGILAVIGHLRPGWLPTGKVNRRGKRPSMDANEQRDRARLRQLQGLDDR